MAEKKLRVHGTVKEKLELYQYKQDHPTVRVSAYLIFHTVLRIIFRGPIIWKLRPQSASLG